MESEWALDRMRLYQLRRDHPDWTLAQLARAIGYSLSWVKKWLRRFRETVVQGVEMFQSHSRAPKHRPKQIVPLVRDAILGLRDALIERYGRIVGAKTILYHLHRDPALQRQTVYLPQSSRTIWRVLKEGGRIASRVHDYHPVVRPEPMRHWELDFGALGKPVEFMSVVDRGTSILVSTAATEHYTAETALLAVAKLLLISGLPDKLRFDNDPRFVGSWRTDGFPSPLMRFLLCLGVEPDLVEPGKPYHKPFVERSIRTLKHECLWLERSEDAQAVSDYLDLYRHFYNHQRANQSSACGNRPPYEAFPELPSLPQIPEQVDPDAWLPHFQGRVFKRRVGKNGSIVIGNQDYYVNYALRGEKVGVLLDAPGRQFAILHKRLVVRRIDIQGMVGHPMSFGDYLRLMLAEARTLPAV
jgi:hypothetical protein